MLLDNYFADKPTRSQSSHRLVNLWTSQLADSEILTIKKSTQDKKYRYHHIMLINRYL